MSPAAFPPRFAPSAWRLRSAAEYFLAPLLCVYLISLTYLVPVAAVGPSWAVWPVATDFVVLLLAVCVAFLPTGASDPVGNKLLRYYCLILGLCTASYLLITLDPLELRLTEAWNDKGAFVGAYQLYRFLQFLVVFAASLRWRGAAGDRTVLTRAVGLTFLLTALGVVAEHFGIVTTPQLAAHLPTDLQTAGPWAYYSRGIVGRTVGTLSFHHAFPPMQILVLAALYLRLVNRPQWIHLIGCVALNMLTAFLTGSRTGLLTALVFSVLLLLWSPRNLLAVSLVGVTSLSAILVSDVDLSFFDPLVERHGAISSSYQTDGFAGRVEIWEQRAAQFAEAPLLLLTGAGFGAAVETGVNGHMLFLHLLVETGLLGLFAFCFGAWRLMRTLWHVEQQTKPMLCATASLLLSCLTQETFYPVPAAGHFLGVFMFAIGITVRLGTGSARENRKKCPASLS